MSNLLQQTVPLNVSVSDGVDRVVMDRPAASTMRLTMSLIGELIGGTGRGVDSTRVCGRALRDPDRYRFQSFSAGADHGMDAAYAWTPAFDENLANRMRCNWPIIMRRLELPAPADHRPGARSGHAFGGGVGLIACL